MSAIQIVLITLVLSIFVYIRSKRKKIIDSIIYTAVILIALIIIIYPDITTDVANLLNVGRGADLVIYLSIVIGLFFYVRLYYRMISLEETVTKLIRTRTLESPQNETKP